MSGGRRGRGAVTQAWDDVRAAHLWPDQEAYALVRPVVLLGRTLGERARETGVSERTLARTARRFIQQGLPGFRMPHRPHGDDARLLPPAVRAFLIVLQLHLAESRHFSPVCAKR